MISKILLPEWRCNMSHLREIKEYIYYTCRPFTAKEIVEELGINYETVKKYLQELLKENYIRQIGKDKGKNVYIAVKAKSMGKSYKAKYKHLTFEDIKEKYRRHLQKQRDEWEESVELL